MKHFRRKGWKTQILIPMILVGICLCISYRYYLYKSRMKNMNYFPILPLAQRRRKIGGVLVNETAKNVSLPGLQKNVYLPDELMESMSMHDVEANFYSYLEHKYVICDGNRRLGNQHDGGWNVCVSPPFTISKPCLVYSFGIGDDWRFEDDMYDIYRCQVMAFDPSIDKQEHNRTDGIWFKPVGLGSSMRKTATAKKWKLKAFRQILSDEGHLEAIIDYLKFDIEYMEWRVIRHVFGDDNILQNVKQVAFEVHLLDLLKNDTKYESLTRQVLMEKYKILRLVESAGFRRFDYRKNPFCSFVSPLTGVSRSGCYELFYLNMKFVEDKHLRSNYALT